MTKPDILRTLAWDDYECLATGSGQKIERFGPIRLQRPEPQATGILPELDVDATFTNGQWHYAKPVPPSWTIRCEDMKFKIMLNPSSKQIGIFPEQASNWLWARAMIKASPFPLRILNLFGYSGGATVACAFEQTAEIVHVDAAKSALSWTRANLELNGLQDRFVRTLADDALKFIQREKRRGRTYHGIIMDPPSFGRGPHQEIWSIDNQLPQLIDAVLDILDEAACFMIINTYTATLSDDAVTGLLKEKLSAHHRNGSVSTQPIGVPIKNTRDTLQCGLTTRWCQHEDLF